MNHFQLVCFDMDGTLIRNTNSVRLLCSLSGKKAEVEEIEFREDKGELNWIDADYEKIKLIKGLHLSKLKEEFEHEVELIENIHQVLAEMKGKGFKALLVTAGPIQVAELLGERYNFDAVYGSDYEVEDDMFTGKIIEHLGEHGKLKSLMDYCNRHSIRVKECIAVGDSDSDVEVFKSCGKAIAINYSNILLGKADVYLKTDDLRDILEHI